MRSGSKLRVAFCTTCNENRPIRGARCIVCRERAEPSTSKYRNVPEASKHSVGPTGKPRVFQSKRERAHEPVLIAMQNAGKLTDLRYQERFRLEVYSTQAVTDLLEFLEGGISLEWTTPTGPALVGVGDIEHLKALVRDIRRARHHVCDYLADFTFLDEHGRKRVHDPKGYRTPVFAIKKRLMLAAHGLEVEEV